METATDFRIAGVDIDFLRRTICDDDTQSWLEKPVWDNGELMFCDGWILVACTCPDVPPLGFDCFVNSENSGRKPATNRPCPGFQAILNDFKIDAGANIPEVIKPPGSDDRWIVEDCVCDECDGSGWVRCDYEHDHDCPYCEATGRTKERSEDAFERVYIGPVASCAKRYVWLIGELVDPFIGMPESATNPVYFTHAGGRGVLMPMEPEK